MPTQTNPQQDSITSSLDPEAVNLAKAIRQTESGGNFTAKGKSGEYGAYQFTQPTWNTASKKYGVNATLDQATPEQQNEVAYKQIKEWKDKGNNVGQIASMWNAGESKPDAYLDETYKGTNKSGAKFDVPAYAKSVATAYQTLKSGGQVQADPNNPSSTSSVVNQNVPQPQQSSGEAPKEGYSVGGFGKNILKSGGELLGGIGNMIMHPIDTIKNLGKLALGAGELLIPGEQGHEESARAVGKFFADRYGGVDNIKNSLYNDPVGVVLDLSTLLTGGGGLAAKIGTVGKIEKLAEAGKIASRVGEVVDPLRAATKATGGLVKIAGKGASSVLGVTTGSGSDAIKSIYNAGREGGDILKQTTDALRGKTPPDEVLKNVQSAVTKLVETEKNSYKSQLEAIKKGGSTLPNEAVNGLKDTFEKQLNELDIIRDAEGGLDFRGSILDGDATAVRRVKQLEEKIKFASENPTVVNIDNLKRFAEQAWKPNEPLNVITQPLKQSARQLLIDNVDGYQQMTSKYHEYKDFLDEVHAAIGNPDRVSQESALRKVRSIFRDSQQEKLSTVGRLEAKTGKNIKGQVAGLVSNKFIPKGLQKYGAEGLVVAAATGHLPAIGSATGLVMSSPRIVAEAARGLGITARKLDGVLGMLERTTKLSRNEILKLLTQSNRATSANPQ